MSTQNIAGATADIVVFRTKDADDDDMILMDSKGEEYGEGHANDDFSSCAQLNPLYLMSSLIKPQKVLSPEKKGHRVRMYSVQNQPL